MYDAIIVGARCAGAPTALLLARKGYKVLLLDRGTFPSDMPFSNHYVHQTGSARLKRWGLLDTLKASNCPPILIMAHSRLRARPCPRKAELLRHLRRAASGLILSWSMPQ